MGRGRYRSEVERLLARIEAQTRELRWLEAGGAHPGALRPLEQESERTRRQLAALVARRGGPRAISLLRRPAGRSPGRPMSSGPPRSSGDVKQSTAAVPAAEGAAA